MMETAEKLQFRVGERLIEDLNIPHPCASAPVLRKGPVAALRAPIDRSSPRDRVERSGGPMRVPALPPPRYRSNCHEGARTPVRRWSARFPFLLPEPGR